MASAVNVTGSILSDQERGAGSSPSAALQSLRVQPIPFVAAKKLIVRYHYLQSMPGGTQLAFGVLLDGRLLGAITFGSGPANAFRMVSGVKIDECLTLTRLWLSDELPANSESRVIGISLRALKKHTNIKFLVSYADPTEGHLGTIYQATNWLYTGYSESMPKFDMGDGVIRHSRSLSHAFGSHSLKHFESHGLSVKVVEQPKKHRYIYLLDKSFRDNLNVSVLPYPRHTGEGSGTGSGNQYNDSLPLCTPKYICTEEG